MKTLLITGTLACALISAPTELVFATTSDEANAVLTAQLGAIKQYLTRLTVPAGGAALTESELRAAIRGGADWLRHAQEPTGHFRYEYIPYEDQYRNDDNIVRQAGALYALGEILRRDSGDPLRVHNTMKQSIEFFLAQSKESFSAGESFRCITKTETSRVCPLGATALALIGTLAYVQEFPEEARTYDALIRDYRAYILAMQKKSGGFRDRHMVGNGSQSEDESAFSNGEALLALVRLYEHEQSRAVKLAIERSVAHLREQPFDSNLYLWMMAALRDLNAITPRDTYIDYAHTFTEWRVAGATRNWTRTHNYCPYAEGLASALALLQGNIAEAAVAPLRAELDRRNRVHATLQIHDGDRVRLMYEEGTPTFVSLATPRNAVGGFLTGAHEPTQRIDFTQHCITGYVQTLVDLDGGSLQ